MTGFAEARKVADAVLYEGYALYPYRASAAKNRVRFQWGVLMPPAYAGTDPSERSTNRTECIIEAADEATITLAIRFLHLAERRLEAADDDGNWSLVESIDLGSEIRQTWDDAEEVEVDLTAKLDEVTKSPVIEHLERPGSLSEERLTSVDGRPGRVTTIRRPISLKVSVGVSPIESPYGIGKLQVTVDNTTHLAEAPATRDEALRTALVGCHTLLASDRGGFVSQMAPPEWARRFVEDCRNEGTYPVLLGDEDERRMMLSSPIILYDHPVTAPESPGDYFDATEMDELLTLRTMTLTDEEKRQARGTDPRTAAIIDQADFLPPEMLDKLHGAIRNVGPVISSGQPAEVPWWDPAADESVSPDTDSVTVSGVTIARGSKVRLVPRLQRADAQDMFLVDRVAEVQAVVHDVDGGIHLAVALDDDPAAEMLQIHGRFLYFAPDEVQPLAVT